MFIAKKHISRRAVLRGMGATVALPFLEAMLPAQTALRKSEAAPKQRLCAIEMVHGAAGSTMTGQKMFYWAPEKIGRDFELNETNAMRSLTKYQDYLTIVSDTDLNGARAWNAKEEGSDHTRSSACYLTAAHPKMTEGADIYCGTSLDQIIAQKTGQDTPLPSIQLCIENVGSLSASCGYGYSCVYANTISWSSPETPLPMDRDPRVVFERLFGAGGTESERLIRRREERSILDTITHAVARLQRDLGPSDRARLGQYLDDVREIERRIQKIEQYNSANPDARALPDAPIGVPDSFGEHTALMFDLQALAFMADITRVSAFKMGRDVSSRVYPDSGVKNQFHNASHHGENPKNIAEFAQLNQYHVSTVAPFLEKLRSITEGDGNLLEHSLVIYGSPMGDSHVHEHKRCNVFLAGHAGGTIQGNLHYKAAPGTPMANLWLTVLHRFGVKDMDTFGDSTAELPI